MNNNMKTNKNLFREVTKLILLLLFISFIGCKPQQIITEKTVTKIDSTSVSTLRNELQKKVVEVELLKTDLERTRDENTRLQSEASTHQINYDTDAPLKPDGTYPIASETKTESKSLYEKTVKEYEKKLSAYEKKTDSLTSTNTDLRTEVKVLTNENTELKSKETQTTGFNFRLFFIGVIVGMVFIVVLIVLTKIK